MAWTTPVAPAFISLWQPWKYTNAVSLSNLSSIFDQIIRQCCIIYALSSWSSWIPFATRSICHNLSSFYLTICFQIHMFIVRNCSRQCQFCVLQYRRDQGILPQYSCYKNCYSWFCMYKCWNTTKFPFHSYFGSNEKITIFFSYFQSSVINRS